MSKSTHHEGYLQNLVNTAMGAPVADRSHSAEEQVRRSSFTEETHSERRAAMTNLTCIASFSNLK